MKNLILFIFLSTNLFSQLPYKVSSFSEEYHDLLSPIIITENKVPFELNGVGFNVPLNIFGNEIDTIYFIENDFITLVLGNTNSEIVNFCIPIYISIYDDEISGKEYSISYQITGEIGHRIITFQWKDFLPEESTDDFFNLQITLNENKNYIDYKFGPVSSYDNIEAVFNFEGIPLLSGFVTEANLEDDVTNLYYLKGNPTQPTLHLELEMEEIDQLDPILLTNYPPLNTVFRFSPTEVSVLESSNAELYKTIWNSNAKQLTIHHDLAVKLRNYKLYNINGQVISEINSKDENLSFFIENSDTYFLLISDNDGVKFSKKLVLLH